MNPKHNEVGPSGKSKGPVVFSIVRDSQCSECGKVLAQGDFLHMEARKPPGHKILENAREGEN